MIKLLASLVNANQIGGWARAGAAVVLGAAAGWFGGKLAPFLTPEFQGAVGVVVSTIAIGVWSSLSKALTK